MSWQSAPEVKNNWQSAPEVKPTKKKAAPKDNSAGRGFKLGALKPVENIASFLNVGGIGDKVNEAFGYPSVDAANADREAARQNNTRKGWQTIGNIAGTLPTSALPGGPLVQGAASGALLSDRKTPTGVAIDAATGAIAGKAGQKVIDAAAYGLQPLKSAAGQALYDAGVPQTLGQIAKGGKSFTSKLIANTEEALTSVPFVGDAIAVARNNGTEGFNTALGNRILQNINEKLPKGIEPGQGMIEFVQKRLSDKYQSLVPNLVGSFDKQFAGDLAKAKQVTSVLPAARQKQFGQMVWDVFGNRANGSRISGQQLKDAESRLTTLYKNYSTSTDADQRIMAEAIDTVRQSLRQMVDRNNPGHAKDLQSLNKGWAQLRQLRSAAGAPGNADGVVTPAQMLSATKRSKFDDQFVKYAKQTLPSTTPDSGTVRRGLTTLGAMTAGTGAAGATVNPAFLAATPGLLLYTKPGMKALNAFVFKPRAKAVQSTAKGLRQLGRVAPAAVPATLKDNR